MRPWLLFLLILVFFSFYANHTTIAKENNLKFFKKPTKIKGKISLPLNTRKKAQMFSDSVCLSIGVPPKLIREIGENESGWRCIQSLSGGSDYGDLQIIKSTFDHWYQKLGLEGGPSRANYLIVGIHYLKDRHNKYGSWEKARFAYARGEWLSNRNKWTALEKKFMNKINWQQYDQ